MDSLIAIAQQENPALVLGVLVLAAITLRAFLKLALS